MNQSNQPIEMDAFQPTLIWVKEFTPWTPINPVNILGQQKPISI